MKKILQYRLHFGLLLSLLFLVFLPRITSRELVVALALFMACNWICLFNRATDFTEDINESSLPVDKRHLGLITQISYGCLIASLSLLWTMPKIFSTVLFFGGFMGFVYSYPIRLGKKAYRLKNILLVKNLAAAVIWTALICLPYYFLFPDFPSSFIFPKVISMFLVSLSLEIMGDIRDIDGDRRAGIRTLPNTIGVAKVRAIALFIFTGYCFWFYHLLIESDLLRFISLPLFIFAQTATFLIILFTTENRPYWYFHLPLFLGIGFCLVALV